MVCTIGSRTRKINKVRSVVGLVIQGSGSLVEVNNLELSRFPCPGVGTCHTSLGL